MFWIHKPQPWNQGPGKSELQHPSTPATFVYSNLGLQPERRGRRAGHDFRAGYSKKGNSFYRDFPPPTSPTTNPRRHVYQTEGQNRQRPSTPICLKIAGSRRNSMLVFKHFLLCCVRRLEIGHYLKKNSFKKKKNLIKRISNPHTHTPLHTFYILISSSGFVVMFLFPLKLFPGNIYLV